MPKTDTTGQDTINRFEAYGRARRDWLNPGTSDVVDKKTIVVACLATRPITAKERVICD